MNTLLAIVVLLNGQPIKFNEAQPLVRNGALMVPIATVAPAMKAKAEFDGKSKFITVRLRQPYGEQILRMKLGSHHASVHRRYSRHYLIHARVSMVAPKNYLLGAPALLQRGRTYLPIDFVRGFDARFHWDEAAGTANITTAGAPRPAGSTNQSPLNQGIRAGEIEVSIKSDKSEYRTGETVKFTVTAINQDVRPRELNFRSGQTFDIRVASVMQPAQVWSWSHGKMFTRALRRKTLAPGETLTFEATWDQTDNDGKPMRRGECLFLSILATAEPVRSAPLQKITLIE